MDLEKKVEQEIDVVEKQKPSEVIKKKIVIIGFVILAFIIIGSFYKALNPNSKKSQIAKEEIKKIDKNSQKESISDDLGLIKEYEGTSINNRENISKNRNQNQGINREINQNSTLGISNNGSNLSNEPIDRYKERMLEVKAAYYEKKLNEELQSRRSSLSFGGTTDSKSSQESKVESSNYSNQQNNFAKNDDPNGQRNKKEFLNSEIGKKNYNMYQEFDAISQFEIKAGTIIPGIMITGINSDLPGVLVGNVREHVFDTVSGNYLLIPQGTRIVGSYDSAITFGQSRILVAWQRLIFPDGRSINLENFSGTDLSGYAGLTGKVDNHTLKLFQAVVLSSMLGAGSAIVTQDSNDDDDWRSAAGQGAGEQILEIGANITNKILNIQPTITVAPGSRFNIIVHSDLILQPYK